MRKIIKRWITEGIDSQSTEDDAYVTSVQSYSLLWALCDDGTLWWLDLFRKAEWREVIVPPIPQDEEES